MCPEKEIKDSMMRIDRGLFSHWFRNNSRHTVYFYYQIRSVLESKKTESDIDTEKVDSLLWDLHSSRQSFDRMYGLAKFISDENCFMYLRKSEENNDSEAEKKEKEGAGKDGENEAREFLGEIDNICKNEVRKTLLKKVINVINDYEPEYDIVIKVKETETSN